MGEPRAGGMGCHAQSAECGYSPSSSFMLFFSRLALVFLLSLTLGLPDIGAIVAGSYSLVNTSPVPVSYPRDSFIPSVVPSAWPVNSTTLANGWNAVMSWGGDPVNLATGNLYHTERDVSVAGRGLPLVFERAYNSPGPKDGPLGFGWTHSFNHKLNFYGAEGGYVRVGWVDGTGAERFFRLPGSSVPAGSVFQAAPGVYSVLKREADGSWSLTEKNGLRYGFESNAGTTAGQVARLLTIKDHNLNTLTLSYNTGCGNVLPD
ncbi:DUF6531 domain-containing protein [Methylocaldum marinum]|nr:DUF6531 domain-containing protein [Methylocaldum marinum]